MLGPDIESYRYLYCDSLGEAVGLEEVQLMEPIPVERVGFLRELFVSGSEYERYQAALILIAWNDSVVFARLESYISELAAIDGVLDPHRLYDVDTSCDWVAGALSVAPLNGAQIEVIDYFAGCLLAQAPLIFFGSGMRRLLEKIARPDLVADLEGVLRRLFEAGQQSQAALFLEPIARFDPMVAWFLITTLSWDSTVRPSPMFDIADALAYVKTAESRQVLESLLSDLSPGVAERATRAIKAHSTG